MQIMALGMSCVCVNKCAVIFLNNELDAKCAVIFVDNQLYAKCAVIFVNNELDAKCAVIFVNNQLDAQFFMYTYVYFYSLHVSDSYVSIIRRITVSMRNLDYVTLCK